MFRTQLPRLYELRNLISDPTSPDPFHLRNLQRQILLRQAPALPGKVVRLVRFGQIWQRRCITYKATGITETRNTVNAWWKLMPRMLATFV